MRSLVIFRRELLDLRRRGLQLLTYIAMPIVLMALLKPLGRSHLIVAGEAGATGAEMVVPGMSVAGGLFLLQIAAYAFFAEHGWGTWERLRATRATPSEIIIGKSVAPLLIYLTTLGVLLGGGGALFGLRVRGSIVAMVAVAFTFAVALVAMGVCLVAVCRSMSQFNAIQQLLSLGLIALGGAVVPVSTFPAPIAAVARIAPSYWAMEGFGIAIRPGGSLAEVGAACAALLVIAAACTAVSARSFRFEETKVAPVF